MTEKAPKAEKPTKKAPKAETTEAPEVTEKASKPLFTDAEIEAAKAALNVEGVDEERIAEILPGILEHAALIKYPSPEVVPGKTLEEYITALGVSVDAAQVVASELGVVEDPPVTEVPNDSATGPAGDDSVKNAEVPLPEGIELWDKPCDDCQHSARCFDWYKHNGEHVKIKTCQK